MSTLTPEAPVLPPSTEVPRDPLENMGMEWEIACDIPKRTKAALVDGYPQCRGDRAEWVAWRANCCPSSPTYLLVCTYCKTVYQKWMAHSAVIVCGDCGEETGGFIRFSPLGGKS